AVSAAALDAERTLIPFSIDRLVFYGRTEESSLLGHARLLEADGGIRSDLLLETASGKKLAEVFGFALKAVDASDFEARDLAAVAAEFFGVEWEALDPVLRGKGDF